MADITYCLNGDCPFKKCERHHSKIKSAAKATGYVSVADFAGTCEKYIGFLVEERYKADIERLTKEVDRLSQCVLYHDGQIVDAIKEFAERLKAVSHPYADTQIVFELQIDNLVKEMTEKGD